MMAPSSDFDPNFKALFQSSPNAYLLLNTDLTIAEANDAFLQVTGREREELIGQQAFEAFPGDPEDPGDPNVRRLKASFEQVLSTCERQSIALLPYVIPRRASEGNVIHEERYWSITLTPICDENGEIEYILHHPTDVTELYKTKEKLRTAQDQGSQDRDEQEGLTAHQEQSARVSGDERRKEAQPEKGTPHRRPRGHPPEDVPTEKVEEGVLSRAEAVQRAYWASEEERERLRRLFDQAPGFMTFLRGPEHVFKIANEAYYQLVGHRDIIGKPVREALPEVVEQGFPELLDQVYESGEPYVGREVEIRLQKEPSGSLETVYVDFIYQPVTGPGGEVVGIFVQGHDVTEKKRVKERLRRRQAQLKRLNETLEERVEERTQQVRELTSRVTMAEQRERERIARILHDGLQQKLYGIQLMMSSLRNGEHPINDEPEEQLLEEKTQRKELVTTIKELKGRVQELEKEIKTMEGQMEGAIQTARRLSVGMSPPVLRSEGLTATLEWLQSHMEETRGLSVELMAEGEFLLEEEMRVLLFQITRELLVNVDRHADAGGATVELREDDGVLTIEVTDEGRGFDPEKLEDIRPEEGFGLIAARERLRPFGGDLTVDTVPGKGTQVTVDLPVGKNAERSFGR